MKLVILINDKDTMYASHARGKEFALQNSHLEGDFHQLISRSVNWRLRQSEHEKLGHGMTKKHDRLSRFISI